MIELTLCKYFQGLAISDRYSLTFASIVYFEMIDVIAECLQSFLANMKRYSSVFKTSWQIDKRN